MPATRPLYWLIAAILVLGSLFAVFGPVAATEGQGAILTGQQWVDLVVWLVGLQAAGIGGLQLAKPAGDALAAKAGEIREAVAAKRKTE